MDSHAGCKTIWRVRMVNLHLANILKGLSKLVGRELVVNEVIFQR